MANRTILFVVNEYAFFISHRVAIAEKCLQEGYEVHIATTKKDQAADIAAQRDFIWHPLPLDIGATNPLKDLRYFIALLKLYRSLRPDIIHHVTIKPILYGSLAARLLNNIPVVNAVSGMGYLYINHSLKNKMIRFGIGRLLRVGFANPRMILILQNKDDRELILSYNLLDADKITIIRGSGVDLRRFYHEPETLNGSLKVGLAARMLWDKGVGEFVAAARELQKIDIKTSFHLFGTPDPKNPRSISREKLMKWDDEAYICYEGFKKDIAGQLREMNIVCLPSYREGLPKALLEAAAVGRPIVTTNVPGCREAVIDGYNGFLVPPQNITKLVEKLKLLVRDTKKRKKMGTNGRELVENEFKIGKVVNKTMEVYNDVFSNG